MALWPLFTGTQHNRGRFEGVAYNLTNPSQGSKTKTLDSPIMFLELGEMYIIPQPLTMPTLHDCKAQVGILPQFFWNLETFISSNVYFSQSYWDK